MTDPSTFIGNPVTYWAERVDHAEAYLEYTEQMLANAVALARIALRGEIK